MLTDSSRGTMSKSWLEGEKKRGEENSVGSIWGPATGGGSFAFYYCYWERRSFPGAKERGRIDVGVI